MPATLKERIDGTAPLPQDIPYGPGAMPRTSHGTGDLHCNELKPYRHACICAICTVILQFLAAVDLNSLAEDVYEGTILHDLNYRSTT